MAAHVLRLRWDLLVGALRGDLRQRARRLAGLLLLVVVIGVFFFVALRLRGAGVELAATITVLAGSVLTTGAFVGPFVGGFDDQLDPRRFAVFGSSARSVAASTLLGSVISVPALGVIAFGVAVAMAWTGRGASAVVTVSAVVLGVLTCLLVGKIAFALSAMLLQHRRSRELGGLFLVAIVVVLVVVAVFFGSLDWGRRLPPALTEAVAVLGLTPLGAAWAIPGAALAGNPAAPLVVAASTVLALAAVWVWLVQRLLTSIERPVTGRERAGLGWFLVMPATPGGGIAARSLIYWLRDPRYLVNLAIVPVIAVLVVIPLLVVGAPVEYVALLPAPLMALLLGWLAHNDLAYDSTALWMHVAGAVRGTSDRIGRLVPVTMIGGVLLAVTIPLTVALHGRWAVLPALVGVCVSLFLCGLGLSSLSSAVAPYAVSRPGDSPFQQPQRTSGGFAQGLVLLGAIALSAPALWWGWLSLSDVAFAWPALWGGIGMGLLVLVAGVVAGGAVFDRGGSRLMEFVEST